LSVVAALVAIVASGCELDEPRADSGASTTTTTPEQSSETAAGPRAALRQVALAAGNWETDTIATAFAHAASSSIGDARAGLRRQLAELRAGLAVAPAEVRARATVEGVLLRGAGSTRRALVVTHERMTGDEIGGEGDRYRVTVATVQRAGPGWAVSEWSVEP
jgi:hypothetical protein